MRLLLHACCAPCGIYPLEIAPTDGFDSITGFFYNPNIHPYSEFLKRQDEARSLFGNNAEGLIGPAYDVENYFKVVTGNEEAPARCRICWHMRIFKSAEYAKNNLFDSFTTTLLGSPYQDHDVLRDICRKVSVEVGVDFYYRDFREGFKEAHKKARQSGMYCQNYCGCIYSEVERITRKKSRRHCEEAEGRRSNLKGIASPLRGSQ